MALFFLHSGFFKILCYLFTYFEPFSIWTSKRSGPAGTSLLYLSLLFICFVIIIIITIYGKIFIMIFIIAILFVCWIGGASSGLWTSGAPDITKCKITPCDSSFDIISHPVVFSLFEWLKTGIFSLKLPSAFYLFI